MGKNNCMYDTFSDWKTTICLRNARDFGVAGTQRMEEELQGRKRSQKLKTLLCFVYHPNQRGPYAAGPVILPCVVQKLLRILLK